MNAELIAQEELNRKHLEKQLQNNKNRQAQIATEKEYQSNIDELRIYFERINTDLQSILQESPTVRQIFEKGNFRNVHFDKRLAMWQFGDGYHIYIQNRPSLIIPVLPGSGEDMRPAIRIETPGDSGKWPIWALKQLKKLNYDLKSLSKEEIVRRILLIRDTYPHWFR